MIDFLVEIMIISVILALFVMPFVLVFSRFVLGLFQKVNKKHLIFITFLPFSIGAELFLPENKYKKFYRICVLIMFVLLVIGSLFLIYTYKSH